MISCGAADALVWRLERVTSLLAAKTRYGVEKGKDVLLGDSTGAVRLFAGERRCIVEMEVSEGSDSIGRWINGG